MDDIKKVIRENAVYGWFIQRQSHISNAAISSLLQFLTFFVHALGVAFQCDSLVHAAEGIPVGTKTVHKLLGTHGNDFIKYVVCPKCHSVYSYEYCIERRSYGASISKLCQHVAFPNHPELS